MIDEELGLLRDICCDPDCNDLRLIYADWLEDHNEENMANFVRNQIKYCCGCEVNFGSIWADAINKWLFDRSGSLSWRWISFWRGLPHTVSFTNIKQLTSNYQLFNFLPLREVKLSDDWYLVNNAPHFHHSREIIEIMKWHKNKWAKHTTRESVVAAISQMCVAWVRHKVRLPSVLDWSDEPETPLTFVRQGALFRVWHRVVSMRLTQSDHCDWLRRWQAPA